MQSTTTLPDTKTIVVKGLTSAFRLMRIDLHALPEDVFDKCLGGKARTVADLVYEVNILNDHVGMVVRGEKPFDWPDGWVRAPENLRSKEAVIADFERMAKSALDTAESFTSEQLEEPFQTEDGETTRFERFRFMTLHTWYHSGQLNFIQTLLGDDDFHWAK